MWCGVVHFLPFFGQIRFSAKMTNRGESENIPLAWLAISIGLDGLSISEPIIVLIAKHITSATSIRLGRLYNRDLIASPTHSTGRSLTSLAPSQTQDFRNQRTVNDGRLIRIRRLWFGQEEQSSGIHRPEPSSQPFDQVEDGQLAQGTIQVHGPTRHVVPRRWPAQPEHLSRTFEAESARRSYTAG